MKTRCRNPNYQLFHRYGGRGIKVCERWLDDFTAFFKDVGPRPSPRHSLERIDNDGDYEPSNVKWATAREQANNTRRSITVDYGGREMSFPEFAAVSGLGYSKALNRRFNRGIKDKHIKGADLL